MLEGMHSVLLCMLEVVEASDVMRCVLICMLEAVEAGLCLLEVLEVLGCWRCRR